MHVLLYRVSVTAHRVSPTASSSCSLFQAFVIVIDGRFAAAAADIWHDLGPLLKTMMLNVNSVMLAVAAKRRTLMRLAMISPYANERQSSLARTAALKLFRKTCRLYKEHNCYKCRTFLRNTFPILFCNILLLNQYSGLLDIGRSSAILHGFLVNN